MPYALIRISRHHIERYARQVNRHFPWIPRFLRGLLSIPIIRTTLYWHTLPATWRQMPLRHHALRVLQMKVTLLKWKWRFLVKMLRVKWKLLQWKWHMLQRFWGLPHWLKFLKLIVLLIAVATYYAWKDIRHDREIAGVFNQYYSHYYREYRHNMSQERAQYYAAYYARYYAEYYASEEYKAALQYALPEPTPQAFSYPKQSKIASLTLAPTPRTIIEPEHVEPQIIEEENIPSPPEIKASEPLPPELVKPELELIPVPAPAEIPVISPPVLPAKTEAETTPVEKSPAPVEQEKPAISTVQASVDGVALIKHFEGFRSKPYLDKGGKLTIGYGHLIRRGELWQEISEEQAEALLFQDIRLAEAVVKRNVTVELTPNQFAALVSLVYNIGSSHFEKSTLLKKLNNRQYEGASREFLRWKKVGKQDVKGLYRRRVAERALFLAI